MNNKATRFIFHIGLMKTGTTALQKTLDMHYGQLLKSKILYPKACQFQSRHVQLIWSCIPQSNLDPFAARNYSGKTLKQNLALLFDEIKETQPEMCLISGEDFSFWNAICFQKLIEELDSDVQIIVYLRPQTEMIESMYRQFVKGKGISSSFHVFLKQSMKTHSAGATRLNYNSLLSDWENLVGEKNLTVYIYNTEARNDIVGHFLFGLNRKISLNVKPIRENISYSGTYLELLRTANEHLPRATRDKFQRLLSDFAVANPLPRTSLLTNEERIEILKNFSDSNYIVAQKYFNRKSLFED